jgi:DNA-binding FrmR family transcriptional regulator
MLKDKTILINQRLLSAGGHLKAVTAMVDSKVSHRIVLHQLCAVQGALKAVSQMILKEYIEECLQILVTGNTPEESQEALDSLLVLYNWSFSQK